VIEGRGDAAAGGRIRLGMVGGGQGAFIGAVHRMAARLDDHYVLVAGALSSARQRAIDSALELGLARDRTYDDFAAMAAAEAKRADGVEAVAIVTPNHLHAPVATAFLRAGIHVICDKPLATTAAAARDLVRLTEQSGKIFAVTYNYTGYPMVRQARSMVAAGELGEIRVAHRPGAGWRGRRAGRHRHARLPPGLLRHRAHARGVVRGIDHVRVRPPAGRRRAHPAALSWRRARHAVGQSGGAGQRERIAAAGVRHEGRARVAARESQ
jgi:predicted dehydrogenase